MSNDDKCAVDWCTITAGHPTPRTHSGTERVVAHPASPAK